MRYHFAVNKCILFCIIDDIVIWGEAPDYLDIHEMVDFPTLSHIGQEFKVTAYYDLNGSTDFERLSDKMNNLTASAP